jgi:hypothetical protein
VSGTVLYWTAWEENKSVVLLLANLAADIEAKDNHGKTTPEFMLSIRSKYR